MTSMTRIADRIDHHNIVFHHGVFEEFDFGGFNVGGARQVEERD